MGNADTNKLTKNKPQSKQNTKTKARKHDEDEDRDMYGTTCPTCGKKMLCTDYGHKYSHRGAGLNPLHLLYEDY